MAWRMKLRLPRFKLTQRSTGVEVIRRASVPRGREDTTKESALTEERESNTLPDSCPPTPPLARDHADLDILGDFEDQECSQPPTSLPSLHEVKQTANAVAWGKIRQDLLQAVTESNAMPIGQLCVICSDIAQYRCVRCGPVVYYCPQCFGNSHSKLNMFHTAEVWDEGVYKPVVIDNRIIDVRPPHACSEIKKVSLCCINEQGEEHNVTFCCCQCEPMPVTMIRARLWPASPRFPQLAFTFELLDWAEALLLECQVALEDFCKALYFKCPHLVKKRKDVYRAMIDAFEEYRYMKVELRNLRYLSGDLDSGNTCPACPKEAGSVVLSMDALFGLPRKKSAGRSFREPLHGHLFFGDQNAVDEYVATAPKGRKVEKSCSDFLAGDVLRSSNRYKALDETAVFGIACRHEFPLMFINLKHGERLAYGEWLLQEVIHRYPSDVTVHLMYDIACTLVKHLEGTGSTEILERVHFAIPSFHAYGHKADCQILYSPSRCTGLGRSDGEVMERLWSYLRRFSRTTKEMRPSHRTDVLCHALIYYGSKTKQKLGTLLVSRWKKAEEMKAIASEKYRSLVSKLPGPIAEQTIQNWMDAERAIVTSTTPSTHPTADWRTTYFLMLQSYFLVRESLTAGTEAQDRSALFGKLPRLENQLSEFEQKHAIPVRWHVNGPQYTSARHAHLKEKQQQLRASLWTAITRRQYLLRMKAKYADGQKIAKKLSKGILKEAHKSKRLLEEYNAVSSQVDVPCAPVSIIDALAPDSTFWRCPDDDYTPERIPLSTKRDITDAFLIQKRCDEELLLLKNEMHNVIHYWNEKGKCITKLLAQLIESDDSQFNRGAQCLLKKLLWQVELIRSRSLSAFSTVIPVSDFCCINSSNVEENGSDSSESDDDSDSDIDSD